MMMLTVYYKYKICITILNVYIDMQLQFTS